MSTAAVRVDTHTHAVTHVTANLMIGLKRLIQGCGLSTHKIIGEWSVLEAGINTWLESRHLERLVLEVFDPSDSGDDRRGRFDFDIDYGYYTGGDGALWMDTDTVAATIRKNGSYPSQCDYRIMAVTSPGRADVPGWGSGTLRSTDGMSRHVVGTTMGGGSLGASVVYWRKP
jgi:Bacterial HORMA domain 2